MKLRRPSRKQIFAYICIFVVVGVTALLPPEKLLAIAKLPLWTNPDLKASDTELSAAVVWLMMANVSSIGVVWLLWRELRAVVKAAQGLHYRRRYNSGLMARIPETVTNEKLTNHVLAPLDRISYISILVLLITTILVGAFLAPLLFGGKLSKDLFKYAIYWTGLLYVVMMTVCDFAARKSYRMLCGLELVTISDPGLGESYSEYAHASHNELLETLGEFNRMIFYVDVPILMGVIIIMIHKLVVLEPGGYYLGFIAGTVAMHTILANIISLMIAASSNVNPSNNPHGIR